MKKFGRLLTAVTILMMLALPLAGCGATDQNPHFSGGLTPSWDGDNGSDSFETIMENPFVNAAEQPDSAFSLDVNTASYSYVRRAIKEGRRVSPDAVRIEEMINYFSYDYPAPAEGKAVSVTPKVFACPWNANNLLLSVGVRTEAVQLSETANNLVFLIDTSGSMYGEDRLGLVKYAFTEMLKHLTENDRISIVTYAGSSDVKLRGKTAAERLEIAAAVDKLEASGSTNGTEGIQTAYSLAEAYFIEGGNNRVVLATDGDFNVGISDPDALEAFISEKSATGVYLTVLGFGQGNYKDDNLEALARSGQGNYAYIDGKTEAYRLFSEAINGTLRTVARDAKAQVIFEPAAVESYRLIGYENKSLTAEEWEDDDTDAGELGSGLTVTALYEIKPRQSAYEGSFASAAVRYKNPDITDGTVREVTADCLPIDAEADEDALFLSAVAEFGLVLRGSTYAPAASARNVALRIQDLRCLVTDEYKQEFYQLVCRYDRLF